jgi:pyruvate dehydrogenase E2 component (dihydrolipoamide acetyltransferase)
MAERTTQSWTSAPHFFVVREIDAAALLEAQKKTRASGVSVTDLLVALAARVLRRHLLLNASWSGGSVRRNSEINIGLAVAVNDGVVSVVIHDADGTLVSGIAARRKELVERARANRLQPADLAGGTFTISNLGMYGVDAFTAIVVPPQAAILAVGAVTDRVVAVAGKPEVRPRLTLTLSCDHRVVDGARAAEFLRDLADAIGEPEKFLQ